MTQATSLTDPEPQALPQGPIRYLSMDMLRKKLGNRGRTTIYRDVDKGLLPPPVRFGNSIYWIEADVDAAMHKAAIESRAA